MPLKRRINEPTLPPVEGERELRFAVKAELEEAGREGVLATLRGVPI